jgi:hypothetical protein
MTPVAITNEQQALVNFSLGAVFDIDSGGSESFTALAEYPYRFYLTLPTIPVTLFSQAMLNSGAQDVSGAFPFIADPNAIAIAFGTQSTGFLSLHSIQPLAGTTGTGTTTRRRGPLVTGYDRIGAVQAQSVQGIHVAQSTRVLKSQCPWVRLVISGEDCCSPLSSGEILSIEFMDYKFVITKD